MTTSLARQLRDADNIDWSLVCDNLNLCWAHAIKCAIKAGIPTKFNAEIVEFVATGICLDVLINCARCWNSTVGVKFSTYLYRALRREVRACECLACECFSSTPYRDFFDRGIQVPASSTRLEVAERKNTLRTTLASLEKNDRLVLLMRYWAGRTHLQIGAAFGHSKTMGQNMVARALEAARKRMTKAKRET